MSSELGVPQLLHVLIIFINFLLLCIVYVAMRSPSWLHHTFLFSFDQLIALRYFTMSPTPIQLITWESNRRAEHLMLIDFLSISVTSTVTTTTTIASLNLVALRRQICLFHDYTLLSFNRFVVWLPMVVVHNCWDGSLRRWIIYLLELIWAHRILAPLIVAVKIEFFGENLRGWGLSSIDSCVNWLVNCFVASF